LVFLIGSYFYIFNSYFFLNTFIIINQINNEYHFDDITGLMGNGSTHAMMLFWVALICLNLYNVLYYRKSIKMYVFILIQIITMLIISSHNDNTAFYFYTPYIIIIAFFKIKSIKSLILKPVKSLLKVKNLILIAIIVGILFVVILKNSDVKHFINYKVASKVYHMKNITNKEVENEERIDMILYSFKNTKNNLLGNGLGIRYDILGLTGKEFGCKPVHINISDVSAFIYEGGVLFTIIILLLYSLFIKKYFTSGGSIIFIVFNVLLFSIYAKLFSDERQIFFFAIMYMILAFLSYKDKKIKINGGKV
jgi:hypothetical protein